MKLPERFSILFSTVNKMALHTCRFSEERVRVEIVPIFYYFCRLIQFFGYGQESGHHPDLQRAGEYREDCPGGFRP